jgi:tetratricopeptide (TPR) repeat protein
MAARWQSAHVNVHRKLRISVSRHVALPQKSVAPLHRPPPRADRRVRSSRRAAILAATLLTGLPVFATDQANDHFKAGRAAFESGNYSAALAEFEDAAAAGMNGPAVQFNIGVAAWRAGHLARADEAFSRVALTPEMAALAHYNRGLVALKRGDDEAARRWFTASGREAGDQRLQQLAEAQLARLPPAPVKNWVGFAAAAVGYDDNIALISTSSLPGTSDVADSFLEAQMAFSAPLDRDWQIDASVFSIAYQDLDAFDQWGVDGGVRYRFDAGNWANEIGMRVAHATIDGDALENAATLSIESRRELTTQLTLRGRYRHYNIDGMNEFDGLTGRRNEIAARFEWQRSSWEVAAELLGDEGDYRNEMLSATRYRMSLDLQRAIPGGWTIGAEARRQHSSYDDSTSGSEDLTEIALAVGKSLGSRWRLFARYAYADNEATLPEFQYHRGRFAAGVDAMF